jgi:hypothetical protein
MSKRKRKQKQRPREREPMTPFYECSNLKAKEVDGPIEMDPRVTYLRNNHYQVDLMEIEPAEPFGRIIWLSVKRTDRRSMHDWRDLQQIKNMVVGSDIEAVEIYPAENRHVDTSNQYHLWCFPDGYRLPFGYGERLIMVPDHADGSNHQSLSRQRPFRRAEQPEDAMTTEEAWMKYANDPKFGTRGQGEDDD